MKQIIIFFLTVLMLIAGGVWFSICNKSDISLISIIGYALGNLLFIPASIWWMEFFSKKLK